MTSIRVEATSSLAAGPSHAQDFLVGAACQFIQTYRKHAHDDDQFVVRHTPCPHLDLRDKCSARIPTNQFEFTRQVGLRPAPLFTRLAETRRQHVAERKGPGSAMCHFWDRIVLSEGSLLGTSSETILPPDVHWGGARRAR